MPRADEIIPDWRLLTAHHPLSPGDQAYVARPLGGGDDIAAWIKEGGSTVLVSGPSGVGRSTELARAASRLAPSRVTCLVQIDRMTHVHQLVADHLLWLVALHLVEHARTLQPHILDRLPLALNAGRDAALRAIEEVARVSPLGRVVVLIDGLERLPPGEDAREVFDSLASLPETADLVVVIPGHVTFRGGTESILRVGERLHRVGPLDMRGAGATKSAEFLATMLARRLRCPEAALEALVPLILEACRYSGGIPRVFLQLMAAAGTYARVKRAVDWPDTSDLREAILDHEDSFRRTLLPGDTQAIKAVVGTDGRELDLERRGRLLAQGILLECVRDGVMTLDVHPLASAVLESRQPAWILQSGALLPRH